MDFEGFGKFLEARRVVRKDHVQHYKRWASSWWRFCDGRGKERSEDAICEYASHLEDRGLPRWQVDQASDACRILLGCYMPMTGEAVPFERKPPPASWSETEGEVSRITRLRKYSKNTRKIYAAWIRRFGKFLSGKAPALLDKNDLKDYLAHLAIKTEVAAATQNQAMNTLLFLYRNVLRIGGYLLGVAFPDGGACRRP